MVRRTYLNSSTDSLTRHLESRTSGRVPADLRRTLATAVQHSIGATTYGDEKTLSAAFSVFVLFPPGRTRRTPHASTMSRRNYGPGYALDYGPQRYAFKKKSKEMLTTCRVYLQIW